MASEKGLLLLSHVNVGLLLTLQLSICGAHKPQLEIFPVQETQVKAVGKNVLLTCQVNAQQPELITDQKWLDQNNMPIDENNKYTRDRFQVNVIGPQKLALVINNLRENDQGNFTCIATYQSTEQLRKSVILKTYVPVTWEDAPEEQFPLLGEDYKVRCKVTARPAPHVDWQINGRQVPKDDRFVMETDGLLIRNVQVTDDGTYTCRAFVMDTGDLQRREINVEVHTPPKMIGDMMTKLEAVEGEATSMACQADGKPPPTYTWIKASTGKNLATFSDRFGVNEITGQLSILKVSREDNGDFKCIANNGAGMVEQNVHLTVIVKPQIVELNNMSLSTGKEAVIECRATGNPPPVISFRKLSSPKKMINGLQPDDERISVQLQEREKGQKAGVLTISSLERPDDGLYACIASNKGGEDIKNAHLTVEFAPSFEVTPMKEAWSWDRRPVNLTCIAESIPNATITWFLNNRPIEKDSSFLKIGNGPISNLLVTPTDRAFYGAYKCLAKNIHGDKYHEIILREASVPSAVISAKIEVITATTITFSFTRPSSTGGRPISAYVVQYKNISTGWNDAKVKTWAVGNSYILENLKPQDQYSFRFAAQNEVGLGPWGADIQRTMPKRSSPEEPIILNDVPPTEEFITSNFPNKFDLRWKKPADNGEYIDEYQIKSCVVTRENNAWVNIDSDCKEQDLKSTELTSYTIVDLQPDTFYKIELRAHNAIGYSIPGEIYLRTIRGLETNMLHNEKTPLSSSLLIAVVVAALFVILIIIDVSCFFVNDNGLLWLICGKKKNRKPREDDAKLSSLYSWRFPLPYCSNKDVSSTEGTSPGNLSSCDKLPLPDVNFVL
ncbi:fasciclin-2 isoform X2 [Halyomorpha halys]|uniref:fasciclin-2 isoform X2 n=1 Tax=Halyomorpha halys TaxID=286706 RepID=UPI0034D2E5DF